MSQQTIAFAFNKLVGFYCQLRITIVKFAQKHMKCVKNKIAIVFSLYYFLFYK